MQTNPQQSPISTHDAIFVEAVKAKLDREEPIVALLRYCNHGGDRDLFILKRAGDLERVLAEANPKDAITVFFGPSFPVRGIANPELREQARTFIKKVLEDEDELVFAIRLDSDDLHLGPNELKSFSKVEGVDQWLTQLSNINVLIGTLAFWEGNSDKMITAYIPDEDGQVRPGAY